MALIQPLIISRSARQKDGWKGMEDQICRSRYRGWTKLLAFAYFAFSCSLACLLLRRLGSGSGTLTTRSSAITALHASASTFSPHTGQCDQRPSLDSMAHPRTRLLTCFYPFSRTYRTGSKDEEEAHPFDPSPSAGTIARRFSLGAWARCVYVRGQGKGGMCGRCLVVVALQHAMPLNVQSRACASQEVHIETTIPNHPYFDKSGPSSEQPCRQRRLRARSCNTTTARWTAILPAWGPST